MKDAYNQKLTRVSRGTPMGDFMRHYWIPAAAASELTADGDPMRLMLLGERLVAFRDTEGKVGVFDHRCPHRGASLFLGRNEQHGLRCIYHGWKFDVSGKCLDLPNVAKDDKLTGEVRARAYQVRERAGIIWVYMGDDQDNPPPLPEIEPALLPDEKVVVQFIQRECNWLQALEGDIDTSHFEFLHAGSRTAADYAPDDIRRFGTMTRDPQLVAERAAWGTMYGAYRPADPGEIYWRIAHFVFPFYTFTPNRPIERHVSVRAWVPMDDEHTMSIRISDGSNTDRPFKDYLPRSTDWFGRWRTRANIDNDFEIDRERQRTESFSGITGTFTQDQAVTESMGSIVDRTWEHLVPSDRMIALTRQAMVRAIDDWQEKKIVPPCSVDPSSARHVRGGYFVAPQADNWVTAYQKHMAVIIKNKEAVG